MKNTPITPELSKFEKDILALPDNFNGYSITLQDRKRKDSETVYTMYPISKEQYNYYFIHFIDLWGKRITFESIDGTIANGYLDSLNNK